MHLQVYEQLIELAKKEKLTTYGDIAPLAGLSMDHDADRVAISSILEEIALFEEAERRPMLTALVVHRGNDNNPGEGFFALANRFGHYNGSRDPLEKLQFWIAQVKAVHSYWKNQ